MTEQTTITTGEHSDADRDTESIHGRLDPPRVNHGTLILSGWVFGQDTVVEQVEICDQRGPIGHAPVNRPRPDVVEALGAGVPAKTGFEARLRPERGSGTSTLSVAAVLSSGERAKLGFVEVSVERKPRRRLWRRRSRSDRDEIEWRLLGAVTQPETASASGSAS